MKTFYHILATVILVFGVVCAIKGDQETFRFGILLGMMYHIYADVSD